MFGENNLSWWYLPFIKIVWSCTPFTIFIIGCVISSSHHQSKIYALPSPSSHNCHLPNTSNKKIPTIDLGTTIVAIQYKDGIVVGADTRTSVSSTYVSHRYANKIVPITDVCVVCRSGSSADTQKIAQTVKDITNERYYKYHGIHLSVSQIAHWLRNNIVRQNDNTGETSSISLIVAGYDIGTNSPQIYSISQTGALLKEHMFAVAGSGSTYIIAHLDDHLKKQKDTKYNNNVDRNNIVSSSSSSLEEGDAVRLCTKVIQMAIHRDSSSGGIVRLHIINNEGIREINILPSSTTKTTKLVPGFADASKR